MSTKAREAFWNVALGNNTKLANLAKLAIQEAENESKREWVGLTDEDIDAEADKEEQAHGFIQGIAWAEAKLKEKNNGFT